MLRKTINKSFIKSMMMPLAMLFGAVFYPWMDYLTFLSPYLIFMMLFITYCKLSPHDFKPGKFELILLLVQMGLAALIFSLTFYWNHTVAEGVFICVFIPTATAAPVITSMLGGSISKVANYSLLCNTVVAVSAPLILAAIGEHPEITFAESFLIILKRVFPLILMPLALAMTIRKFSPNLHAKVMEKQQLSFYLWVVALLIVVGTCTSFAIQNWTPESTGTMIMLAIGALIVCLLQFKIGRKIGARFDDPVSGGQSLGQKNTVLAVWLALAYLNPISSIAPASYVAWQNIINSWQLMKHQVRVKELEASTT